MRLFDFFSYFRVRPTSCCRLLSVIVVGVAAVGAELPMVVVAVAVAVVVQQLNKQSRRKS